jgi:hypothetical protein
MTWTMLSRDPRVPQIVRGSESLELSDENFGIGDGRVGYAIAESKASNHLNSLSLPPVKLQMAVE